MYLYYLLVILIIRYVVAQQTKKPLYRLRYRGYVLIGTAWWNRTTVLTFAKLCIFHYTKAILIGKGTWNQTKICKFRACRDNHYTIPH